MFVLVLLVGCKSGEKTESTPNRGIDISTNPSVIDIYPASDKNYDVEFKIILKNNMPIATQGMIELWDNENAERYEGFSLEGISYENNKLIEPKDISVLFNENYKNPEKLQVTADVYYGVEFEQDYTAKITKGVYNINLAPRNNFAARYPVTIISVIAEYTDAGIIALKIDIANKGGGKLINSLEEKNEVYYVSDLNVKIGNENTICKSMVDLEEKGFTGAPCKIPYKFEGDYVTVPLTITFNYFYKTTSRFPINLKTENSKQFNV